MKQTGVPDTTWIAGLLVVAVLVTALAAMSAFTRFGPTGFASTQDGTASADVQSTVLIQLPVATVNFGSVNVNTSYNTTGGSPAPFEVQNDGNVNANVTVNATALWSGTGGTVTSAYYQFACGDGEVTCPAGSQTTFTDMPISDTAVQAIANQTFESLGDRLELEIKITVPNDEPAGAKTSTVYFTASAA